VSIEQVLGWQPEVIVTIDPNFYANVWRDPLWQPVAAVRSGRVYLAPNVPFGWIDFPPSINRLIGLHWLAKVLYPELFSEDLRPAVRDFYTRAYHRTPTTEQLDSLLAAAEPRPRTG
jgi:iron complex transport system substrate-binding protein